MSCVLHQGCMQRGGTRVSCVLHQGCMQRGGTRVSCVLHQGCMQGSTSTLRSSRRWAACAWRAGGARPCTAGRSHWLLPVATTSVSLTCAPRAPLQERRPSSAERIHSSAERLPSSSRSAESLAGAGAVAREGGRVRNNINVGRGRGRLVPKRARRRRRRSARARGPAAWLSARGAARAPPRASRVP